MEERPASSPHTLTSDSSAALRADPEAGNLRFPATPPSRIRTTAFGGAVGARAASPASILPAGNGRHVRGDIGDLLLAELLPYGGMASLPSMTNSRTRASLGFFSSRSDATEPVEPASASAWQPPHPETPRKTALPAARVPGGPGVVSVAAGSVDGGVAASVPPQPAAASAAAATTSAVARVERPIGVTIPSLDVASSGRRGRYDWRDVRGRRSVTDAVTVALAALGIVGQIAAVALLVAALLAAFGVGGPLRFARDLMWGNELWLTFVVAAVATLGSLFFSDIADFPPCKLCWFQRICMYPLAIVVPLMALAHDRRAARYVLPLPIIGIPFTIYHLLIERGIVEQAKTCLISAPGGCATKWIEEFGYVTIPTLSLTAFVLCIVLLVLAILSGREDAAAMSDAPTAEG